jgi:hypothetical protein
VVGSCASGGAGELGLGGGDALEFEEGESAEWIIDLLRIERSKDFSRGKKCSRWSLSDCADETASLPEILPSAPLLARKRLRGIENGSHMDHSSFLSSFLIRLPCSSTSPAAR